MPELKEEIELCARLRDRAKTLNWPEAIPCALTEAADTIEALQRQLGERSAANQELAEMETAGDADDILSARIRVEQARGVKLDDLAQELIEMQEAAMAQLRSSLSASQEQVVALREALKSCEDEFEDIKNKSLLQDPSRTSMLKLLHAVELMLADTAPTASAIRAKWRDEAIQDVHKMVGDLHETCSTADEFHRGYKLALADLFPKLRALKGQP